MRRRHHTAHLLMLALSALIIGAGVWLAVSLHGTGSVHFHIAQGVLILSLILLWLFRAHVLKPLHTIAGGMNLLREQDFGSRLRHVGQPEADSIVDMFNEMMERLKNERLHVREQNHFLDLLIQASPMGIVVLDGKGNVAMLNDAAAAFLDVDRSHAIGTAPDALPGPLPVVLAALPEGATRTIRLNDSMIYRCARLSYMDRGFAHHFFLIERLTDEVMRAERTAYEKVIRMMAHEVNNSMAGVNSIIDTAVDTIADRDIAEALSACRKRCIAMSEFVTSFAAVVKIPEASLRRTSLDEFLLGCSPVLESLCADRGIELRIHPCGSGATAMLDSVLMEQVLINLVKNAAESIGSDGRVDVRVLDTPARITVDDNGAGIAPADRDKIFSPFFSSKASGRGLGLLFAADVLNKHRCTFSLRTDPDGITRFRISFP